MRKIKVDKETATTATTGPVVRVVISHAAHTTMEFNHADVLAALRTLHPEIPAYALVHDDAGDIIVTLSVEWTVQTTEEK